MATPNASSMLVANGSIRKFCGMIGSSLTRKRFFSYTPNAFIPISSLGSVAGTNSVTSSNTNSAIPLPNTAALIRHSAIEVRTLAKCISSSSWLRRKPMSRGFGSCRSSLISKNLPRPNVASSISATELSTACCVAGEIRRERSLSRALSDLSQIPRQIR